MQRYRIRHLPVVLKDQTLIGMVSDRDIRSAMPSSFDRRGRFKTEGGDEPAGIRAQDIMTKDPISISLATTIQDFSLCGLGQACSKPALSTLKYFLKEFEDHIKEHRCAGAVCDSMVISACQHACPAGIDVPNYVAAIAEGDYEKSVEIIRENGFQSQCFYVFLVYLCVRTADGEYY